MSRNFYILSGMLLFFALLLAATAVLPVSGSLGRTGALLLLLASLGAALIGVLSHLFEQVERRSEEERRRKRRG